MSEPSLPGWGSALVGARWTDQLAAVEGALAGAARSDGVDAFIVPLRPFATQAADRVAARVERWPPAVDGAAMSAHLVAELGGHLARLAARTLVLELNLSRERGELRGHTERERFIDFLRRTASRDGISGLFQRYPVLARLIDQACEHAVEARVELLRRFAADRDDLVAHLLAGVDPGPLMRVESGKGDPHGKGRTVSVLCFADGRSVVYKPRSLDLHGHFGELVDWLNGKVPELGLRGAACLPRSGYGWMELVEQAGCADRAGIDRFYRRLGALLAALYALDATDIHFENLIAAGDQPVVVDLETLFHPALGARVSTGSDPAGQALSHSVHRTALLPRMLLGEHGAFDISGLGGDKGAPLPLDGASWEGAGTDRMRLVRSNARFPGAANRPRVGDTEADPDEHLTALVVGFRTAYDAIATHRAELLPPGGVLSRFAADEVRLIVRNSQRYAQLLDESTHPEILRAEAARDRLLELVWSEPLDAGLTALAPHEHADLRQGDVPAFTCRPDSRDVWTASGARLPEALPRASMPAVVAKIGRMGEADRLDQEWLISATLVCRTARVAHRVCRPLPEPPVAGVPDPQRFLLAACRIGDELVARALHDDHRANWIGLEVIDDRHWALLPMGAGLASGYCGVALFLGQLGELTGTARYTELARKALRPVPSLLASLVESPERAAAVGCGGFEGLGGICFALARLSVLLGDADLGDWLATALDVTGGAADPGQHALADGLAGGLVSMLAVHAETGSARAATLARSFADTLAATAGEKPAASGFLHGDTGIAWALLRAGEFFADRRHVDAATSMLAGKEKLGAAGSGWCSGTAGRVIALARAPGLSDDEVDGPVDQLAGRAYGWDFSLCHGEFGVVEALAELAATGHERAAACLERDRGLLLGAVEQYGPVCGTPRAVPTAGLLNGVAGIGYGLLRLGFGARVPSVLLVGSMNARR
ncbi:MAG: type 2 lantipeptide synthetase LanM family protein [Actinobacteria bacterium]|nr:type 2 lantipeptide synthetase LanM family protein [Actinomycetota bacterium]